MKKVIYLLLPLLFIFLFFYFLRGILLPFVLAFILAYILNPIVLKLEKRKLSRTTSTAITVAGLIILILAALFIIFPILEAQVVSFVTKIPSYAGAFWEKISPLLERLKNYITPDQMEQLRTTLSGQTLRLINEIGALLSTLFVGWGALFNIVSFIVITPVITFYILSDWPSVIQRVKKLIPLKCKDTVLDCMKQIDMTLSAFIRGQTLVCLTLAFYYGTCLSLVGLDLGFSVGFITGLFAFIPYVGSLTGFFLSMLLAFTQGASTGVFVGIIAVFLIGQFLEGYVLTPKLIGKKVGLHPAWIIFALFSFGYLFGFLGVLLAVPTAAVLGVLLRIALNSYEKSSFYKGTK